MWIHDYGGPSVCVLPYKVTHRGGWPTQADIYIKTWPLTNHPQNTSNNTNTNSETCSWKSWHYCPLQCQWVPSCLLSKYTDQGWCFYRVSVPEKGSLWCIPHQNPQHHSWSSYPVPGQIRALHHCTFDLPDWSFNRTLSAALTLYAPPGKSQQDRHTSWEQDV